jgi:hypothetical protein
MAGTQEEPTFTSLTAGRLDLRDEAERDIILEKGAFEFPLNKNRLLAWMV